MDYQTSSIREFNDVGLPCQAARKAFQQTVTQLLDDSAAMDDWCKNIEKIRQKESGGDVRQEA